MLPKKEHSLLITGDFSAPLSKNIQKEYNALVATIHSTAHTDQNKKITEGTGGLVSVTDLLAYQIGWGKSLLNWYQSGLKKKKVQMPGHGFDTWDYVGLAQLFYEKYHYDAGTKQKKEFFKTVRAIIDICESEYESKDLDAVGVWDWCTLASGKQWPLSKWIQVNTVAPYKRARTLIKKYYKD